MPSLPLPPHAWWPRCGHPHPRRDPDGYLQMRGESVAAAFDPAAWWRSPAYLHGFDLFNRGYYWEAHDAWEGPWHDCGRRGAVAELLQALIRLAGAGFKQVQRQPGGRRRLAEGAAALVSRVADASGGRDRCLLGLHLGRLHGFALAVGAGEGLRAAPGDGTPGAVFATLLLPER